VVNWIIGYWKQALGIGLIFLVVGAFMLSTAEVKCGGKVMQPGQTCEETSGGSTVERDYDEQKADGARSAYLTAGFGGVSVAFGALGFALWTRQRSAAPR
jgi:hypothetical protein